MEVVGQWGERGKVGRREGAGKAGSEGLLDQQEQQDQRGGEREQDAGGASRYLCLGLLGWGLRAIEARTEVPRGRRGPFPACPLILAVSRWRSRQV